MVWLSAALVFQYKAENATILEDNSTGNLHQIQLIEYLSLAETAYWQPRMLWWQFDVSRARTASMVDCGAAVTFVLEKADVVSRENIVDGVHCSDPFLFDGLCCLLVSRENIVDGVHCPDPFLFDGLCCLLPPIVVDDWFVVELRGWETGVEKNQ